MALNIEVIFASLPADRFAGCYQIPQWALPPLRTLSVMANRTFHTVLTHFSFVHMPTFRLIDTAACLAFAICTVGGIRSGKQKYDYPEILRRAAKPSDKRSRLDGPLPPGQSWESMYKQNYEDQEENEEFRKVEGWENGLIVKNDKSNMLVKVDLSLYPQVQS